MKKFTKICLITAAILILIGGTICALGFVSGGWRMVDEMEMDHGFWHMMSRLEGTYAGNIINDIRYETTGEIREEVEDIKNEIKEEIKEAWEDARDDIEDAREDVREARNEVMEEIEEEFLAKTPAGNGDTGIDAGQVRKMKINIGGAGLCLLESGNNNFGVLIDGKADYRYYESKGVFYLEGGKKHLTGNNNEKVYLYIPKGKNFDEVEINIGGGLISIGELDADEIEMNTGAGVIACDRIRCHDLSIEVGAGEAVLGGIEADEMDIEVGMGSVSVQGRINREIDASCGMGYISMELDNAETDFNYKIECAAGAIRVGDRSYGAMKSEIKVNNGASGECSLECSMGSIDVAFTR